MYLDARVMSALLRPSRLQKRDLTYSFCAYRFVDSALQNTVKCSAMENITGSGHSSNFDPKRTLAHVIS